jgi:hypothetical protein
VWYLDQILIRVHAFCNAHSGITCGLVAIKAFCLKDAESALAAHVANWLGISAPRHPLVAAPAHRLGSDRGSPNHGSTLLSKAGDGADPVAGEGEDDEADPVADAGRGAQVGSERWLTVGSCRDEVEPSARAEDARAEAGHDVSALVCEGHRWHGDKDVVREKATSASRSADS